jgi:hypothetical protein
MFVFIKAPNYILHSTLCVNALCMHFLSLQIYLFNFISYILHYVCAFFVYASISQDFKLHFAFYIFVFVHYVCIFCLHTSAYIFF